MMEETTRRYYVSEKQLKTFGQLCAVQVCDLMGVNTELSYTRASAEFGQFFRDMVRTGRLSPVRVGKGRNGTRWYSASDILALRAAEESKAVLL